MTRAIVVAFHKYQPYGGEFYEPILDFFLKSIRKYQDEYDRLYILDSTWNIDLRNIDALVQGDAQDRYYDAYKRFLPDVKEDLVLFMDNDMVVYREGIIDATFNVLTELNEDSSGAFRFPKPYDVVSIYDTCGTYATDKLNGNNKFCPYWFATRKDLLMKYRNINWGPDMPYCETLGHLTEAMLIDGVKPYQWEEDKSSIYFDGTKDGERSKDLGYYHIRSGSLPAYLLAERAKGNKGTYWEYLKNQPKREYLRQCAWYEYMGGHAHDIWMDAGISIPDWENYCNSFKEYHGLI